MFILICLLFLAPPTVNELPIEPNESTIEKEFVREFKERFQITETRIIITPDGKRDGKDIKFSIWMPNRPIKGDDFIFISHPLILTLENVTEAFELLHSQ